MFSLATGGDCLRRPALPTGLIAMVASSLLAAGVAQAQEQGGGSSGSDLAQQLANPVSDLISVPFQNNYDCCFGSEDGGRYTLNIQPVMPFSVGEKWNLITRTIVPIISQERTTPTQGSTSGFGDIVQSFFLSPKAAANGMVWGVGPVILYPTGKSSLGTEKWGAGPTAVVLKQMKGGITAGVLANHIWSFAGDNSRSDVSSTFIQPFLTKTLPDSTTFALNTESTYDWKSKKWTVPVNLAVSHIFRLGSQPVQMGPGARYYVSSPTGGPEWGVRFNVVLLFPKGH
ncbi:Putative MetA-pathway of phenol degradation [Sphingomonas laterariae]|uniref:Putative MetA-pathway of phenol degradation n=1 Tax=Edaphosphingomonas laterariae TaxID=861865 RepID=A0A239E3V4_9SPHN|nr:transporter [Sphingomonas laterariae]SNS39356.1 Putative MetA-pathway of phenol degradation [Sphingomonas laterariae]